LAQEAEQLAAGMTKLALKGRLDNTKMLVALVEKMKPEEAARDTRLIDWIERLTGEPPYKDERGEGLGEVGEGGLEPEGWERRE